MLGTLPTREKGTPPAFLNDQSGNLRDGCMNHHSSTLLNQNLWDPATSFWAHPGMPENMTFLGDTGWIGELTNVLIYPICANMHPKIVVLATPIQGLSGSRDGKLPSYLKSN